MVVIHNDPVAQGSCRLLSDADLLSNTFAKYDTANILTVSDDGIDCLWTPVIIIFRYLLTVENWFRRPELYHYQFSTIAWHAMSSALHNDTQKKRRQIQTVSLDDMIPGCEDLTWGDVITEKNLEYVPYAEVS